MTEKEAIRASKFLSLVLRHQPEKIGLELDTAGWVGVDTLLAACQRHGFRRSTNGVWLVDAVPPEYINFPNSETTH